MKNMFDIAFGTEVCGTGYGSGDHIKCGSYTRGPRVIVANVSVHYPHSGADAGTIDIDNMACGYPLLDAGDSGGPIFLDRTVQGSRFAIALGVASNFRGDTGERCWDSVGHINVQTPNHIVFP
jgi:hypothetical protein